MTGNNDKVSHGGQLIRDTIKEKDYVMLNNMAIGGPWTRVQRGKESIQSCLDIGIASRNRIPFLKSIIFDENRQFTPKRVIRKIGELKSVFADHFTMEIKPADMPKTKVKTIISLTWSLKRPVGWENYKDLWDTAADKIDKIVTDENLSIDEKMKAVVSIEN